MKVKIKRFDTSLPLPEYKTPGAACFDVYSRITIEIEPKAINYIPLNIALKVPDNHWVMLVPRSSTHKMGIMSANSVGIGDSDFSGDNDEYKFAAYNFTDKKITIDRGTRVAQMMVIPFTQVKFEEVEKLQDPDRGGFGTTGKK